MQDRTPRVYSALPLDITMRTARQALEMSADVDLTDLLAPARAIGRLEAALRMVLESIEAGR